MQATSTSASLWKWAAICSSVVLVAVLSLHERKKRLVYRYRRPLNWLPLLKGDVGQAEESRVGDLVLANAIMQAVERYLLPLTCTGVVSGEGIPGMVILRPDGQLVSAATSGERACPVHTCEYLCLEDAAICVRQRGDDYSENLKLSDCIFVSTHRCSIVDMGLPLLQKCGVKMIYALFESPDYSKRAKDAAEENINSPTLNRKLLDGVLGRGDNKLVSGIEILPFFSLIGEIDTKAREFGSEEDLKNKMALDQMKLKAQTRMLAINRAYGRLSEEIRF